MKKRKSIKLEGQKYGADGSYRSRRRNVNKLLVRLDALLRDADEDFVKTPKSYGHSGSMAKVEADLIDIIDFLSEGEGVERV